VTSKPIIDLGRRECRYAVGEDDDGRFLFCAEVTAVDEAYCPMHRKICFEPPHHRGARKVRMQPRQSALTMRREMA